MSGMKDRPTKVSNAVYDDNVIGSIDGERKAVLVSLVSRVILASFAFAWAQAAE